MAKASMPHFHNKALKFLANHGIYNGCGFLSTQYFLNSWSNGHSKIVSWGSSIDSNTFV